MGGGSHTGVEDAAGPVRGFDSPRIADPAVDDEVADMDALRRELASDTLRETAQREFAHRKRRRQRIARDARRSAGEEDRAVAFRQHAGRRLARDEEPRIGADHYRALDLGWYQFDQRPPSPRAGIVDDDIGRADR